MLRPAALYNHRKWQLIGKSQWCGSAMLQLQHTPPPQSTTPGLHPVSIHQIVPPVRVSKHPITANYNSVCWPRKDERLSQTGWLVTYRNKVPPLGVEPGHVTHPSTNRAEWWTLHLWDTSPTEQFAYCLVISPTGHFAYWSFRLRDISPIGQFTY